MATRTDDFLSEGLRRWGRAQGVLNAFEVRLGEELARIGTAHAAGLRLSYAKPSRPKTFGWGKPDPSIRVEFACRFGEKKAELILGVQWEGKELEPSYYAAFYEPRELTDLSQTLTPEDKLLGLWIEHEEKRDWVTVPAGELGLDEGFARLLAVLRRKVDSVSEASRPRRT